MLRASRILRQTVARNIVADATVYENEELLSESVAPEEFAACALCKALLGSWPDGCAVERLLDERFANGYALLVGREGTTG